MTTGDVPDYYAEFGIDRAATANRIATQLDQASRTWQQRASLAPELTKRRAAEDKVKLVSEARKVLLDSARRRIYDADLDASRPGDGSAGSVPGPRRPNVRDWVGHARRLIDLGDLDGAQYVLQQAVHHDDGNGDAWRLLGWVHLKRNQPNDALQEFKRALPKFPHDAFIHTLIAHAYEQLRDPSTANGWRLEAARLAPDDIDIQVAAADGLFRTGRHDEALSAYQQVLAKRLDHTAVRDQIGRIWSLRAQDAMVWHPVRQQYVIDSPMGASWVMHCVDQAMAVGVSDVVLTGQLDAYRREAIGAVRKIWRWREDMGCAMFLCFLLTFVKPITGLAFLALLGLPFAMGWQPRWRHTGNDLLRYQRQQTGRDS